MQKSVTVRFLAFSLEWSTVTDVSRTGEHYHYAVPPFSEAWTCKANLSELVDLTG